MNEAPVFGEKINKEKISHLEMKFRELELEEGLDNAPETRIKRLGMFLENEKANLTSDEIKELKERLLPKSVHKAGRKPAPEMKKERRSYID